MTGKKLYVVLTVCLVATLLFTLQVKYHKDVCVCCGALHHRTAFGLGVPFTDNLVLQLWETETIEKTPYSVFLGECAGGSHKWIFGIYESAPLLHNLWFFHGKGSPGLRIYPVHLGEGLLACLQEYEKQDPDIKTKIRAYFADPDSSESQNSVFKLAEFCLDYDGNIKTMK